ncbi:hypothetical protein Dimus_001657 [Dionaea muscipula]
MCLGAKVKPTIKLFHALCYLTRASKTCGFYCFRSRKDYKVVTTSSKIGGWKSKFVLVSCPKWPFETIPQQVKFKPNPKLDLTLSKAEESSLEIFDRKRAFCPWFHEVSTLEALEACGIASIRHPRGGMLARIKQLYGKTATAEGLAAEASPSMPAVTDLTGQQRVLVEINEEDDVPAVTDLTGQQRVLIEINDEDDESLIMRAERRRKSLGEKPATKKARKNPSQIKVTEQPSSAASEQMSIPPAVLAAQQSSSSSPSSAAMPQAVTEQPVIPIDREGSPSGTAAPDVEMQNLSKDLTEAAIVLDNLVGKVKQSEVAGVGDAPHIMREFQQKVNDLQAKLKKLVESQSLRRVAAALVAAQKQRDEANSALEAAQRQETELHQRLEVILERRNEVDNLLDTEKFSHRLAKKRLQTLGAELQASNSELENKKAELEAAQTKIRMLEAKLLDAQDRAAIDRREMSKEINAATQQIVNAERVRARTLEAKLLRAETKRQDLEQLLPKQLAYDQQNTIRNFLASDTFKDTAAPLAVPQFTNGFRLCQAQVQKELAMRGYPEYFVGRLQPNFEVPFEAMPDGEVELPSPQVWDESAGPSCPLLYMRIWAEEQQVGDDVNDR